VNVQERLELGQKSRPVDELLAAYAAGSLSGPLMVLMSAHLELKPARRAYVAALEAAFGILLEEIHPVPLTNRDRRLVSIFASDGNVERGDASSAGAVLNGHHYHGGVSKEAVRANGATYRSNGAALGGAESEIVLPLSLQRYVGQDFEDLEWRTMSGLPQSVLAAGDFGEASLIRIRAGKRTPPHGHHGLEVTLVLKGGFSDGYGQYRRGDICVADEGVEHQPIADPDEDCVVFVVRSAPMKLVGTVDRMIQLFLGR
jgi:putative transcriptional regulator